MPSSKRDSESRKLKEKGERLRAMIRHTHAERQNDHERRKLEIATKRVLDADERQQGRVKARLRILEFLEESIQDLGQGHSLDEMISSFCTRFNSEKLLADPEIRQFVGKVSRSTIWVWRKAAEQHGTEGLKPTYRGRSAPAQASPEIWSLFVEIVNRKRGGVDFNDLYSALCSEAVSRNLATPSERTIQRWLRRADRNNAQTELATAVRAE